MFYFPSRITFIPSLFFLQPSFRTHTWTLYTHCSIHTICVRESFYNISRDTYTIEMPTRPFWPSGTTGAGFAPTAINNKVTYSVNPILQPPIIWVCGDSKFSFRRLIGLHPKLAAEQRPYNNVYFYITSKASIPGVSLGVSLIARRRNAYNAFILFLLRPAAAPSDLYTKSEN